MKQIWDDPHAREGASRGWRSRSRALYYFHARNVQSNAFIIGSNGSPSPRMRLPQSYPSRYKHDIMCLPQAALFQIQETTASPGECMNRHFWTPVSLFRRKLKWYHKIAPNEFITTYFHHKNSKQFPSWVQIQDHRWNYLSTRVTLPIYPNNGSICEL